MFNPNADDSESRGSLNALDWDSALFVPTFMMCTPPSWLWEEYVHEEGVAANPGPTTKNGRELREIFEEAAGDEYKRVSDSQVYRLARRMCREVLTLGVGELWSGTREECDRTLKEWERCLGTL